jgi:hypothetical protein
LHAIFGFPPQTGHIWFAKILCAQSVCTVKYDLKIGWLTVNTQNEARQFYKRRAKRLLYLAAACYSVRSATIGSTLAARAAGTQDARSAAAQSNKVAMVSIRGSHGATPKS